MHCILDILRSKLNWLNANQFENHFLKAVTILKTAMCLFGDDLGSSMLSHIVFVLSHHFYAPFLLVFSIVCCCPLRVKLSIYRVEMNLNRKLDGSTYYIFYYQIWIKSIYLFSIGLGIRCNRMHFVM